jgi:hypothetical protein
MVQTIIIIINRQRHKTFTAHPALSTERITVLVPQLDLIVTARCDFEAKKTGHHDDDE